MSFHEKSAWACVTGICLVYVPYFVLVFRHPMAALGLMWLSVIGLAALLAAFHIAIALATRSVRATGDTPPVDELDQKIELTASKWASLVLGFAVLTWILVAMYSMPLVGAGAFESSRAATGEALPSTFAIPVFTAMTAVHWLFAGFVVANLAYYGGIVIGYRRLAGA